MHKYLLYGSYTAEGFKGLLAEGGPKRVEAVRIAVESVGGTLESFYFSLGENDFYVIVDLPDNVSATAFSMAGNASTYFTIKTVSLLTPEELDKSLSLKVNYRYPGT